MLNFEMQSCNISWINYKIIIEKFIWIIRKHLWRPYVNFIQLSHLLIGQPEKFSEDFLLWIDQQCLLMFNASEKVNSIKDNLRWRHVHILIFISWKNKLFHKLYPKEHLIGWNFKCLLLWCIFHLRHSISRFFISREDKEVTLSQEGSSWVKHKNLQ